MRIPAEKGYTLIEIILTAAIVGIVILAISQLIFPLIKYFQQSRARQQTNSEARVCLETIARVLSNAMASSMVISTPVTTPAAPQASEAQFQSVDGSTCTVIWSTSPMNTVHLLRTPPGGTVAIDTVLASHVTGFSFAWATNDPSLVNVTLQMTVPLDASGSPNSTFSILLPPMTTRLRGS